TGAAPSATPRAAGPLNCGQSRPGTIDSPAAVAPAAARTVSRTSIRMRRPLGGRACGVNRGTVATSTATEDTEGTEATEATERNRSSRTRMPRGFAAAAHPQLQLERLTRLRGGG